MTGGFVLRTVLRVRRLQEDLARAEVAAAQERARRARSEHARREATAAGRPAPGSAEASRWLATVAANLALAADAHAAARARDEAEAATAESLASWQAASAARKGVERLAERHAEEVRREAARRDQLTADDLAGAAHHARTTEERP